MGNQNQSSQQEINIVDNLIGAEYSNAMQVVHGKDEFLMTFFNIVPPSGRVCGKIVMGPGHFKRTINTLLNNLEKYEKQFGKIEEAESPKRGIGFETN
jgi:hypothetical protein